MALSINLARVMFSVVINGEVFSPIHFANALWMGQVNGRLDHESLDRRLKELVWFFSGWVNKTSWKDQFQGHCYCVVTCNEFVLLKYMGCERSATGDELSPAMLRSIFIVLNRNLWLIVFSEPVANIRNTSAWSSLYQMVLGHQQTQ